jgi:ribosomal protein S18 acetylase RimI-like enzyme
VIELRDAVAEELSLLAERVAVQPLLTRYGATAEGLARDLARALAAGDGLIVAVDGARLVGFAWFLGTGTFGGGGYLRLITLAPGEEGRGVGARLLAEVERRVVKSARSLFLMVSHWNHAAQRFYTAHGYAHVGRVPAFVRADTDELIFYKRLDRGTEGPSP